MKKLILLLALALGVEVKGQIVGGFMPQNSTKSFTAGNATFSNVIARGTLSVGSTATVTGALKCNNSIDAANYKMNGTAIIEAQNTRILLGGGSYTAVEISGSEPLIMNSAVLTGGNTGTVAVLSDAVFPITLNQGTGNPADGATFYLGNASAALVNNASYGRIRLPYNSTLVAWDLNWYAAPGSAESVTVSIAGTTTLAMSSTITFSAAAAIGNYTATGLSNNFNAGDLLNIKFVCPTWVTNPTILHLGVTLWFVRRS